MENENFDYLHRNDTERNQMIVDLIHLGKLCYTSVKYPSILISVNTYNHTDRFLLVDLFVVVLLSFTVFTCDITGSE